MSRAVAFPPRCFNQTYRWSHNISAPAALPLQRGASPDQGLDGESDNGGEQEEGRDQDVKERQGGEGLERFGDGFVVDLMGHKSLEDKKKKQIKNQRKEV